MTARAWPWLLAWAVLTLAGAVVLGSRDLDRQEEAFQTDARIAHRLLSQRAVQHDAVLAMLALLQPETTPDDPRRRLPAIFPQLLRVERRLQHESWPADLAAQGVAEAEAESRRLRHATTAESGFAGGRLWLVLAAEPASYALQLDLKGMVPAQEWPPALTGAMSVALERDGARFVLNEFVPGPGLRQLAFRKPLASDSQAYEIAIARSVGLTDLPWTVLLLWALAVTAVVAAHFRYHSQTRARQRAEELLRLGQATRLNALGELAAGLAHELNQPLTAVMANTQAAGRLLAEDPAEIATARDAMAQAVAQAQRAADVLGRLRRAIGQPGTGEPSAPLRLLDNARHTLDLLEPECRARNVVVQLDGDAKATVVADPVALEQIVHNLVSNALQALERVPEPQRRLEISVLAGQGNAVLRIADSGPGIPADALPRVFEPFFTTRAGGLGLGLSLSETLASSMGGRLAAANGAAGGAVFTLTLPLAAKQ